jgi:tetratricopeptide (TPR) repeat protein
MRVEATALVFLSVAIAVPAATAQRFRLPASLSDLEARATRDSNDAAAHYNVALAYWNERRFDDAERALKLSVVIDPRFAAAYLALAHLPYARRGQLSEEIIERRVPEEWKPQLEEADRYYRRAFLADPLVELRVVDVVRTRAAADLRALELLFGEPIRDFFDGLDQLYQGRYQDAYDRLSRVINALDGDRHPRRVPSSVWYFRGLAAAHVSKYVDATNDFKLLLDRSLAEERTDSLLRVPLRTNEWRYLLAYTKQQAGELNPAIDFYTEALANDAGLYMAHVQLANMYEQARMWEPAITQRRRAVNANPDDASLLLDLGRTLAAAGQWGEASDAMRQAAEANPRDARALYYLGVVHQRTGQVAAAREAFNQFIGLAPSRYQRQVADAKQRLASLQ